MKIVLACGGTGGHIFPAFSVAEEIKKRHPRAEIIYACGHRDLQQAIFKIVQNEKIVAIESAPFRGKASLLSPSFIAKIIRGFREAAQFLKREKPDVVVGFGGYAAFPVVWLASFFGIKTLIHEQNVVPGIANKFLARFSTGLALSFDETRSFFKYHRNIRVTGNPIRSAIERDCREEALQFFGFKEDKITLLVLGGSQGAESINAVFLEFIKKISASWKQKIQVLHLCGKMQPADAEKVYAEAGVLARVYSFFDRMDLIYGVTDMALGRAGATFLAEIAAKEIPAILVPYPHGNGHQLINAQVFSRNKRARVIEQKDLTTETLEPELVSFFEKNVGKKKTTPSLSTSRVLLSDFIEEFSRHD